MRGVARRICGGGAVRADEGDRVGVAPNVLEVGVDFGHAETQDDGDLGEVAAKDGEYGLGDGRGGGALFGEDVQAARDDFQ